MNDNEISLITETMESHSSNLLEPPPPYSVTSLEEVDQTPGRTPHAEVSGNNNRNVVERGFNLNSNEMNRAYEVQVLHDEYPNSETATTSRLNSNNDVQQTQPAQSEVGSMTNILPVAQKHVDAADFSHQANKKETIEHQEQTRPADKIESQNLENPDPNAIRTIDEVLSIVQKDILLLSGTEIFRTVVEWIIQQRKENCMKLIWSTKIFVLFTFTKHGPTVANGFRQDCRDICEYTRCGLAWLVKSEYTWAKRLLGTALDLCFKNLELTNEEIMAQKKDFHHADLYPYAIRILITELYLYLAYVSLMTEDTIGFCEYLDHAILSCPVKVCRAQLIMLQGIMTYNIEDYYGQFTIPKGHNGYIINHSVYWAGDIQTYLPNILIGTLNTAELNCSPLRTIEKTASIEIMKHAVANGRFDQAKRFAKYFTHQKTFTSKYYLVKIMEGLQTLYTDSDRKQKDLNSIRRQEDTRIYFSRRQLIPIASAYSEVADRRVDTDNRLPITGTDIIYQGQRYIAKQVSRLESDMVWIAMDSAYPEANQRMVVKGDRLQLLRKFEKSKHDIYYEAINWSHVSRNFPAGSPDTMTIISARDAMYQPYATIKSRVERFGNATIPNLPLPIKLDRTSEYMSTTYLNEICCECLGGPVVWMPTYRYNADAMKSAVPAAARCETCKLAAFESDTPLMRCLLHKDIQAVLHLVGENPGLDVSSALKHTLHMRPPGTRNWIIGVLLYLGADIDKPLNEQGQAALHHAVQRRLDSTTVSFLVRQGADINVQDANGETPLAYVHKRRWTIKDRWEETLKRTNNKEEYNKNTAKLLALLKNTQAKI